MSLLRLRHCLLKSGVRCFISGCTLEMAMPFGVYKKMYAVYAYRCRKVQGRMKIYSLTK